MDQRPTGAQSELLTGAQFLHMIRHVVDFRGPAKLADPLKFAVEQIVADPAFSQSRLLRRILVALASGDGEFRRAEVGSLDAATLALVIALIDMRAAGTRPEQEWLRATESDQAGSV